jgi:hypothetical protein
VIENSLEPCDEVSASLEMRGRDFIYVDGVDLLVPGQHFFVGFVWVLLLLYLIQLLVQILELNRLLDAVKGEHELLRFSPEVVLSNLLDKVVEDQALQLVADVFLSQDVKGYLRNRNETTPVLEE